MKKFYLLVLFAIPQLITAQSELETLEQRKGEIVKNIEELQKELTEVEGRITILKSQHLLNNVKTQPLLGIARKGAYLKEEPDVNGKIIMKLDEDTPVQIVNLIGDYFQACINERCGYMSELWVNKSEEVKKFKNAIRIGEVQERRALMKREQEQNKQERLAHEKKMIQKYGKAAVEKMNKGIYWTGMNKEMLQFVLGEPEDINSSIGSWGKHEQWVYPGGVYVYFEDGIVTAMQD